MTDEANAVTGRITGEQLEHVFSNLHENAGELSVDILVQLAKYYRWSTEKLLEAVCFYLNCRQTVIRGEDLKAVRDARQEAFALKNRLRMLSDAFDSKCDRYRQLDDDYCRSERELITLRADNAELKRKVKDLENRTYIEILAGIGEPANKPQ